MNDRKKGKSLITIPKNYVLVDLETTGFSSRYNHIMEVGAIKVHNGKIIDKYQSLVNPIEPIPLVIRYMTRITDEMVADAPKFDEIAQDVWNFLEDEIIVGYNISFDINFLYDNFLNTLNKNFQNDWLDILRLSRKIVKDIDRHGLIDLCEYFDITLKPEAEFENDIEKLITSIEVFQHHRAINDCLLANKVLERLFDKVNRENINLNGLFKEKCKYDFRKIQGDESLFNKDHIFYGKNCVFTGKLEQFIRSEAAQIVANIGGHCENTVNKKTNFLIVGDMDYREGMNGNKTSKLKKAEQLISNGQDLQILPESAFYDLISDYIIEE